MKITMVASGSYEEDYEGQILHLLVSLSEGETVQVNDVISIEMMDDTFIERPVVLINPKKTGDFYPVSEKIRQMVESGKCRASKKLTKCVKGPCNADLVVIDVPYHDVKTDEAIAARRLMKEMSEKICLSPYKELLSGDESIYDHVQEGYTVPDKVITYLRTTKPYLMSPGVYEHPFKPGKELLGPYMYEDGIHYWDRDLWKYVVKYHVTLPEEFINYVMSGKGDAFIEECINSSESWSESIKDFKKQDGIICLLPDDAGDSELTDF